MHTSALTIFFDGLTNQKERKNKKKKKKAVGDNFVAFFMQMTCDNALLKITLKSWYFLF